MRRKQKTCWCRRLVWLALFLVAFGYGVMWYSGLFSKPPKNKPVFSSVMLPRFLVSTARLPDGKEVVILLDRRTGFEYLAVVSSSGAVSITSLPWKAVLPEQ